MMSIKIVNNIINSIEDDFSLLKISLIDWSHLEDVNSLIIRIYDPKNNKNELLRFLCIEISLVKYFYVIYEVSQKKFGDSSESLEYDEPIINVVHTYSEFSILSQKITRLISKKHSHLTEKSLEFLKQNRQLFSNIFVTN